MNVALDGERLAVMREQMQSVSAPCSLGADRKRSSAQLQLVETRITGHCYRLLADADAATQEEASSEDRIQFGQ